MRQQPDTTTVSIQRVRDFYNTIPDDTGWKKSFQELFGEDVCQAPKPWEWIKTTRDAQTAIDGLAHQVKDNYEQSPLKVVDDERDAFNMLQIVCLAINGGKLAEGEHYEIMPYQICSGFSIQVFSTDDKGMSPRSLRLASYEQAEHCLKWFEGLWKQYYGL